MYIALLCHYGHYITMVTSLHHYGNVSHLLWVSPNHNVLCSPPTSCSVLFVPLAVVVWDPEAIGIITY